jgi:hypothetical protein
MRPKLKYCLFPLFDSTIWPMGRAILKQMLVCCFRPSHLKCRDPKKFPVIRKKKINFVWFFRNPKIRTYWDRILALPPGENGVFSSIFWSCIFSYFCINVFTNKRKQNTVLVRNVFIGCRLHEMYVLLNRVYFASYVPFARSRLKHSSIGNYFSLLYTIIRLWLTNVNA